MHNFEQCAQIIQPILNLGIQIEWVQYVVLRATTTVRPIARLQIATKAFWVEAQQSRAHSSYNIPSFSQCLSPESPEIYRVPEVTIFEASPLLGGYWRVAIKLNHSLSACMVNISTRPETWQYHLHVSRVPEWASEIFTTLLPGISHLAFCASHKVPYLGIGTHT